MKTVTSKKRVLKLAGALVVVGSLLAACSGTGKDDDATKDNAKDLKYAVITHSGPGDAFWDRVKSGAEKAGDDYGVAIKYSADPDPAQQSQLIDSAVADKYDGIVVSMANPDGLEEAIKKAVAAGVPVVTINSGVDRFKEFGAITHIGQTETIAGEAVGERLKADGAKNAICVIQEAGNVGLEERCKAVAETFGGKISNLQVDGTDDSAVQATITSKLQTDKSIDTVLTLGGQYAIDAVGSIEESGSSAKVATFDLSEDVIKNIQDGKIEFAVDQQPYVQGFLGVTTLYLKDINGNDVGGGQPVNSGPAFITKENADAVLKFAANGTR
ncbi:sugar ABC transporter substrate-binding protein [Aeromicrobium chenweiae]|uniref:Sugar ABC transporter substrate-binding protein n=1 Tax=Aeromicrobium chenweiae TaxID=2079793 RepID=A0A2S0WK20_9ACTN|nr:sugar ABC transporter substrate-binding protein [Aeromicrobium chenweiae]AWB91689.1 sugar ABC transporter substrate-binding protein [Aeromicrobium chenweiae]TGN32529.1 sugar ABC transporter substrate-binding protein [Aeromicrobium chenweiae]